MPTSARIRAELQFCEPLNDIARLKGSLFHHLIALRFEPHFVGEITSILVAN